MRSNEDLTAASDLLVRNWEAGTFIDTIPEEIRPRTRAEGYAIQSRLDRLSAKPLIGWKIAATSLAGQQHINVDGPLAGRLVAERCFASGDKLRFGRNRMAVAEAEFCFKMGYTLPPRASFYAQDEVMAAVSALHLAIEVPDSRFIDFTKAGAAQLIADNACAHEFVLGPEAEGDWRHVNLAEHVVTGHVMGKSITQGKGANVLGDPRIALTWLANELRGLGIPLMAGQVVTTGTCVKPMPITAGDHVMADFGSFGKVSVRFR